MGVTAHPTSLRSPRLQRRGGVAFISGAPITFYTIMLVLHEKRGQALRGKECLAVAFRAALQLQVGAV